MIRISSQKKKFLHVCVVFFAGQEYPEVSMLNVFSFSDQDYIRSVITIAASINELGKISVSLFLYMPFDEG